MTLEEQRRENVRLQNLQTSSQSNLASLQEDYDRLAETYKSDHKTWGALSEWMVRQGDSAQEDAPSKPPRSTSKSAKKRPRKSRNTEVGNDHIHRIKHKFAKGMLTPGVRSAKGTHRPPVSRLSLLTLLLLCRFIGGREAGRHACYYARYGQHRLGTRPAPLYPTQGPNYRSYSTHSRRRHHDRREHRMRYVTIEGPKDLADLQSSVRSGAFLDSRIPTDTCVALLSRPLDDATDWALGHQGAVVPPLVQRRRTSLARKLLPVRRSFTLHVVLFIDTWHLQTHLIGRRRGTSNQQKTISVN